MGVSRQQALDNRRAIVTASEKLFRERGIDGVGLSELMKAAGFTQGGFYNHFPSKEALAAEVVKTAMDESNARLRTAVARPLPPGASRLGRQVGDYLSGSHCGDIEGGCPMAGLAADVRRLGDAAQGHFSEGLGVVMEILTTLIGEVRPGDPEGARREAIALYSQMVGALVLARAVGPADPAFADEIRDAARETLLAGTAGEPTPLTRVN